MWLGVDQWTVSNIVGSLGSGCTKAMSFIFQAMGDLKDF